MARCEVSLSDSLHLSALARSVSPITRSGSARCSHSAWLAIVSAQSRTADTAVVVSLRFSKLLFTCPSDPSGKV